ncbi:MAG: NAD-dependent epimerase/dehydratase family protein [Acidobacteriota bacterium]|nr:NAD-dependent epimerase/dehydratase family protein [Acidobacteriota bacterium]
MTPPAPTDCAGALPRRVVVTGGAGFIGANLCRALAGVVEELLVLDDLSTGRLDNLDDLHGVTVVEGSILDAGALRDVLDGADAVVHLAARPSVARSIEDPGATHAVNATGTLRVLQAAVEAGRPHVIVASSSSVYGGSAVLPAREEAAPCPRSPYAASKLAAEGYARAYQESFGLPVLCFRFFNVFGPLQRADHAYAAVVPAFVSAALRHEPLPVHGDGSQTRDFTFVGSVVAVLVDALVRRVVAPGPVNLAFGGRCSVLELAGALEAVLGRSLPRHHLDPRPGDVRDSQADRTRLGELFPDLDPVALEEGLRRTISFVERQRDASAPLEPVGILLGGPGSPLSQS